MALTNEELRFYAESAADAALGAANAAQNAYNEFAGKLGPMGRIGLRTGLWEETEETVGVLTTVSNAFSNASQSYSALLATLDGEGEPHA